MTRRKTLASDVRYLNTPAQCQEIGCAPPKVRAKPDVLYWDDNGRVVCGACAGATLRFTLRTLSGHRAPPVSAADLAEARTLGWTLKCEECGKPPCAQ